MCIYVNSAIQRCPNKIIKIFLIEDFFHLPPVSATTVDNPSSCEYLHEFSKKFETVPNGYSGAGGKLIDEKTRSKKSRDTVPLTRYFLLVHYTHKVLTYVDCRVQSSVWRLPNSIDPPPPAHPASVSSPPDHRRGATHSLGGEGVGGQYFGKRQNLDWPLTV